MTPQTKAIVALLRKRARAHHQETIHYDWAKMSLNIMEHVGARNALRDAAREVVERYGGKQCDKSFARTE